MKKGEPTKFDATEAQEIVQQANVELATLLGIEQSLRFTLQWMTRDRGNNRKLATLRFQTWSFEQHLARIQVLADHGGYLRRITDGNPHLAGEVVALRDELAELHANLQKILVRLDYVSGDDAGEFGNICADLERFLNDLRTHGQKESELLQHSFAQEQGGSG